MARSHRSYSVPFQGFPAGDPSVQFFLSPAHRRGCQGCSQGRRGTLQESLAVIFICTNKILCHQCLGCRRKSQMGGLFSALVASSLIFPDASSTLRLDQALSCSQTSLHSSAAACNTLSALLALGNAARTRCHSTVTSARDTVALSSRHLRFLAMPEVSTSLGIPQLPVFRSVSLLPLPLRLPHPPAMSLSCELFKTAAMSI